jgi:hypothetical protein
MARRVYYATARDPVGVAIDAVLVEVPVSTNGR